MINLLKQVIISMRPKQWAKNIVIFVGLVFSKSLMDPVSVGKAVLAFLYFSLISGMAYILNDIFDIKNDKVHPVKAKRPIASGKLSLRAAWVTLLVLTPAIVFLAYLWSREMAALLMIYFVLQIAYTLYLKHVVLLDIFSISASFVLRVISGAVAIGARASSWLLFCTLLMSLFLSLCKRRHEMILMKDESKLHRKTLDEYNVMLLDQLISLTTSTLIVCYILYTISAETISRFGTDSLKYTTLFAFYGIFRYLYLTYSRNFGGSPENILTEDKPFLVNLFLYAIAAGAIIYFK